MWHSFCSIEPEVPKPVKKFYCGCKDPGRREKNHPKPLPPPEDEEEDEDEDDESDSDDYDLEPEESIASIVPQDDGKKGSVPLTEKAQDGLPPSDDVPVEEKTKKLSE